MKNNSIKIQVVETMPAEETSAPNVIWQKIAKTGLYLLVFLAPIFFLPLTIAPVEINKQFLALVLVLAVFFCYLILSINSRRIFYPRSWLSLAILIFLAMIGVSAIFSQSPLTSLFGNFIQPDALLPFLIYGLAFFLTSVFIKREDLVKVAICFLASLTLTAILGLLQIFGKFILPWDFARQISFNPIGSVFGWGIFITFGLVMLVAALTSLKLDKVWKISLSLIGLLIMATLVILNFQMLWVGLVLAMFLLAFFRFAVKAEMTLPLIIITISLFFILASRQLPVLVNLPIETRPSLDSTLTVTKGVFSEIKPIFLGSGPATFGYNYSQFRPIELNLTDFWPFRFNQGFSFVLTILSNLGIPGLLSFLFVIYSFIRQGLKVWSDEKQLVLVSGISFLLINLFFYPAFFNQLLFIFLGLGLLVVGSEKDFKIEFYLENKRRNIRDFAVFAGAILLISFSLFLLYVSSQRYAAAIYYAKGLQSPSLVQSADWIERAARLDPQSDQYWRGLSQVRLLQSNELSRIVSAENAQEIQNQLQNIITGAINAARRATELNPANSLNWANLGNVYENMIPIEDADIFAKENYNKVIELEPNNPQSRVDLARVLIVLADRSRQNREEEAVWREKLNEARIVLDKSIALKFDYAPAHFLVAQIYLREDNLAQAIEKLEEIRENNLGDVGLAFQLGLLYYQNNQLNLAQNEFERALRLNENFSNARYFLGLIYDQKGQKQRAIEQFERIEQLNPDNQEVKNILVNLRAGREALEGIVPPDQPPVERIEAPVPETSETKIGL